MHEAYLPGCQERCREIARTNREFAALIQQNKSVTPEVKAKLEQSAGLRAHCSEMMLTHFYEVAAAMPPKAAPPLPRMGHARNAHGLIVHEQQRPAHR